MENKLDLIGMDKEKAIKILKETNVPYRIVQEDGEIYSHILDWIPKRVNLSILSGIVIAVTFG